MGVPTFREPWTPHRFNTVDFILAKRRWRNGVLDVEAQLKAALISDHALVVAKLKVELRKITKTAKGDKTMRYRAPTAEQQREYNKTIA